MTILKHTERIIRSNLEPTKSANILVPINILLDSLKYFNFSGYDFVTLRTPTQVTNNYDFLDKVCIFDTDSTYRIALFLAGYRHSVNIIPDRPFSFYK